MLDVLRGRGIQPGTDPFRTIESLLEERPSQAFLDQSLAILKAAIGSARAANIVDLCVQVAGASGGFLNMGTISDQEWTQGDGNKTIDLSTYFTGSGLVYSIVSGPGNIEDGTSLIAFSTAEVISGAVVVRATNSGGFDEQTFAVEVVEGDAPSGALAAIPLADITLTIREDFDHPGSVTWHWIAGLVLEFAQHDPGRPRRYRPPVARSLCGGFRSAACAGNRLQLPL